MGTSPLHLSLLVDFSLVVASRAIFSLEGSCSPRMIVEPGTGDDLFFVPIWKGFLVNFPAYFWNIIDVARLRMDTRAPTLVYVLRCYFFSFFVSFSDIPPAPPWGGWMRCMDGGCYLEH